MSDFTILEWSELVANFSVIGGAFVVAFNIIQARKSVEYGRAELFLILRDKYLQIREQLVRDLPGFDDSDYPHAYSDLPAPAKSAVTQYWTNAFNEWCATKKIYKAGRSALWETFYANAQATALLHRPLREGLLVLMTGPHSFGGFKREYKRDMRRLGRLLLSGGVGVELDPAQREKIEAFVAALDAIKVAR